METEALANELKLITKRIWQQLVNGELELISEIPQALRGVVTYGATVHILGGWFGSVSLECSPQLIRRAAATMLNVDQEEVSSELWESVLKELTNITGGNIKKFLGDNCILSIPNIWQGQAWSFAVPETETLVSLCYQNDDGFLIVRVHQGCLDLSDT